MISLDFLQGTITYDELSMVQNCAIEHQAQHLKEDMLQVEYPDGFLIDVGWYPSFDPKGQFQIRAVKNHEWDLPTLTLTAQSIDALREALVLAQVSINTEPQTAATSMMLDNTQSIALPTPPIQ
ncbi:hypothetical protein C4J93_3096 [Pseudomonas sp. R2-37-08W]|uniref:hypothetical protein n=1 Tax=Pseudomonas sp. R2-37-08W TaxID=1173273 RepID=UPI000F6DC090|nr:hypothetical protein [Pseudomonas sp. R2-37-08W]AZF11292.1 hypothetical protein C4J93_3096 [Pseudomonas sp. R2-37-08W]